MTAATPPKRGHRLALAGCAHSSGAVVQHAAELAWAEAMDRMRPARVELDPVLSGGAEPLASLDAITTLLVVARGWLAKPPAAYCVADGLVRGGHQPS